MAGVLVLAVVLTLALFDWNHLRGPSAAGPRTNTSATSASTAIWT
ncbi:hypothetical protein MBEBAB_0838 [Brevundimonas abyssalis TAR-001]|uniref:Uncharacterized protein n=1 Tax=Brevundimonas abyssalis TAR-001 TaxID=1391729 RepID=A0A8E0NAV6_9CAUL|nr:hypothetical protein MBEBAB_0838 [Brevundimonas abyssalis TAR-001]